MALNLNQLRIFLACGKHRSFSEAAEALFLTQPAVTMQIKQLEAYFEIGLFHRHGRTIELTEPGRILFEYAQKIFKIAESAEKAILELKDLRTGILRVGTLKIYAKYMMPPLISSYQEKYPGIHVVLDEGSSTEITRSLIDYKNELGLISSESSYPPQFEVIPYTQERMVLVLGRGHPLNKKRKICLSDLAQEPLIVREKGSVSRQIILNKYREAKIKPHILTEATNLEFIIEQVQSGKGITFTAEWAVKDELARGSLKIRSLTEGPFLINVEIAYLKNRILSPAARAFMDLLIEKKARTVAKQS